MRTTFHDQKLSLYGTFFIWETVVVSLVFSPFGEIGETFLSKNLSDFVDEPPELGVAIGEFGNCKW